MMFQRKSAGTNLGRSTVTFQGKSAEIFLENIQISSLFKNVSLLTFLSADLCPVKFVFEHVSELIPKHKCYTKPKEVVMMFLYEVCNDIPRKQCTQGEWFDTYLRIQRELYELYLD